MSAWQAVGGEIATTGLVEPGRVAGPVLDIRQDNEYAAGHLPGATQVELGDLAGRLGAVPDAPVR